MEERRVGGSMARRRLDLRSYRCICYLTIIMRPDYSLYLTPEQLQIEETHWATQALYKQYAALVQKLNLAPEARLLEVGCGTGWVPTQLPASLQYLGLDNNAGCLELARAKNPERRFVQYDIREFARCQIPFDAVVSFAVLKHFGLHEWDQLVGYILRLAPQAAFTLPVYKVDALPMDAFDNGTDFPHVWIRQDRVERVVEQAGHRLVAQGMIDTQWDAWFITERV